MTLESAKMYMLGGTVVWFVTAPFWLGKKAT